MHTVRSCRCFLSPDVSPPVGPKSMLFACCFCCPPLFRCRCPHDVVVVPRLLGGTLGCPPPLELLPPPSSPYSYFCRGPRWSEGYHSLAYLYRQRHDNSCGGLEVCWLHHPWSVTSLRPPLVVLHHLPFAPRAYFSWALVPEGHKSLPARCADIGACARGGAITLAYGRGRQSKTPVGGESWPSTMDGLVALWEGRVF